MKRLALSALAAAALVSLAVPAGAATAAPPAKNAVSGVKVSTSTPTAGDVVDVSGTVRSDHHAQRSVQIQVHAKTGSWRTVATTHAYSRFDKAIKLPSAGDYQLRAVALPGDGYAKATSKTIGLHVQPVFPVASVSGNTLSYRVDKDTAAVLAVGQPSYDSSVEQCYGQSDPAYCSTDTPQHGVYLTLPLTITQTRGSDDYNLFNYSIKTSDGQVWGPTSEDTQHGYSRLGSGTLIAPDSVSGAVVFDVPAGQTYRLQIEDFGRFIGYVDL